MAQVYPYRYNGKLTTRQDKCKACMPLDKPRIWLDFNEVCADDENGEPVIYLFSQADIVNDSEGNDVLLYEGKQVSVFDNDVDNLDRPDAILAEGIVIGNTLGRYPHVKWLIRLTKNNVKYKSGNGYVYWMSDLQEREEVMTQIKVLCSAVTENTYDSAVEQGHQLLSRLYALGEKKEAVYECLLSYHDSLEDGISRDCVAEILDFIAGWCSQKKWIWKD